MESDRNIIAYVLSLSKQCFLPLLINLANSMPYKVNKYEPYFYSGSFF